MVAFGAFRLDLDEERVWQGPKLLSLRRKPFAILRYLVAHPNRLVTHGELLEQVWQGTTVTESAVRSHLHELRQVLGDGVIETVVGRGYRFIAPLRAEEVVARPVEVPRPPRALVGRDRELAALRGCADHAADGHRQLCFVVGDPGIGKTTVIRHLVEELQDRGVLVAVGHCIEQHSAPEPYFAVIEILGALLRSERGAQVLAALVRCAPAYLAQAPHAVPEATLADVRDRARGANDARMLRELRDALEEICAHHPVAIVVEDLQWSDLATIDLLSSLGQRRERAKLLVIATSRRAEAPPALTHVMRTLVARFGAASLALEAMSRADLAALVEARFPGHRLPGALLEVVMAITGGTPLFVTSLLDELVQRDMIAQRDGAWTLAVSLDDLAAHRPDSVTQLIDIQLDRLAPEDQRLLEAASLIGTAFSTVLVAAALQLDALEVEERCDELARRHLFLRRVPSDETAAGITARFALTHALVQTVCLERTSAARQQRMHRLIAEALEATGGAEAANAIAHHFDQARLSARAIPFYRAAARSASDRHATADARVLFQRALALVATLPEAERDATELPLLIALGQLELRLHHADPARSTAGPLFERTVALARRTGDPGTIYAALVAVCLRESVLANFARTREIVDELQRLAAAHTLEPSLVAYGETVCATQYAYTGETTRAVAILEREARSTMQELSGASWCVLPTALFGSAMRATMVHAFLGGTYSVLGKLESADRLSTLAIELAERVGDTLSIALASIGSARLHLFSRDLARAETAVRRLEANPDLDSHIGFEVRAMRACLDGVTDAEELVRAFRERVVLRPGTSGILAISVVEALRRAHPALARTVAAEMLAFVERTGERMFVPLLRCQHADLLEPEPALAGYRRAHLDAVAQESPLQVLIAALGLHRATGERAVLEQAIAAMPEGHELPIVAEARAALADQR